MTRQLVSCGITFTLLCAMATLLSACGEKAFDAVNLPGDDEVLARVERQVITRYDLDQSLNTMLGDYQTSLLDARGKQQALESLVISRAMAQQAVQELNREDLKALDKKVAAYREKQLVNFYLKKHASVMPVTDDMVKQYYTQHPERFGGRTVRSYEMLFTEAKPAADQRAALIKALGNAGASKDWQKVKTAVTKKGLAVQYRKGEVDEKILHPKLQALMQPLKPGEASNLSFVEGKPYVVRILGEEQLPPKPLHEVSAEIRKSLVPVQLKQAIKLAADELLKTVNVEYPGAKQP